MPFINGWWITYIILAAITTVVFVSGYVYGIVGALGGRQRTRPSEGAEDERHYTFPIAMAVILSAVVIGVAGANPAFVYIGALLDLVTAAVIGLCFFVDKA
jgi:multisubunit Na+/H+ antiporter MnhC subunit